VRNASLVPTLSPLPRFLVVAGVAGITAVAWFYLVAIDRSMSQSMGDMTMTSMNSDLSVIFAVWTVMMIGMMVGSAAPTLLLFGATRDGRGDRRASWAVLPFGLGYLIVWVGFSADAALAEWWLRQTGMLSPALAVSQPLAGVIFIAVGAYQLSPLKSSCLRLCRSPLGFLMAHWRDGIGGALRMGLDHGWYCLGCCWALMCVLFAVGTMNLAWVAGLSVLVLVEKIGPAGTLVARAVGVVMIVAGVLFAAGLM